MNCITEPIACSHDGTWFCHTVSTLWECLLGLTPQSEANMGESTKRRTNWDQTRVTSPGQKPNALLTKTSLQLYTVWELRTGEESKEQLLIGQDYWYPVCSCFSLPPVLASHCQSVLTDMFRTQKIQ